MNIDWQWYRFDQLTTRQLFEILRLRANVFIVEQQDPFCDPDDHDFNAWHVLGYCDQDLMAYSRVIPTSERVSIGRIVVKASYRGQGIASRLLTEILRGLHHSPQAALPLALSAQAHLQAFYQRFGFRASGPAYALGPIMHIDMEREALAP